MKEVYPKFRYSTKLERYPTLRSDITELDERQSTIFQGGITL